MRVASVVCEPDLDLFAVIGSNCWSSPLGDNLETDGSNPSQKNWSLAMFIAVKHLFFNSNL